MPSGTAFAVAGEMSTSDDDDEGIFGLAAETGDAHEPVAQDLDTVSMIVDAFIGKFGKQAAHVAERQVKIAGPDSVEAWREIVQRLKHVPL